MKLAKGKQQEKLVTVGAKVRPIERLAIEQAAASGNTSMSRFVRAAIIERLKKAGAK